MALGNCFLHGLRQSRQPGLQIFSEMHAQRAAAALGKNSEIAAGLCRLHDTEGVPLPWYRQILGVITSDLEKNAAIRAAFVGLSGGVQKSRAETENGSHFFLVAHRVTNRLQRLFIRGIHGDVAEDTKIIACLEPRKMGLQNISKSRPVHCSYILLVGEKLDAACFNKWYLWRQAPGGFVLARPLLRFYLAGLHVGLVEGIDADDGSRHSRSDLPPEKFLAQIVNIRERNTHNPVPGLF